MPLAQVEGLIYSARQARDLLVNALTEAGGLDIGYIGVDDEQRLPVYPAVVVSAGARDKELHGTHTYLVTVRCLLWVYHGKLSDSHRQRSDSDLQLVEDIEAALERDLTFGNRIIHGYVENEQPGVHQPKSAKGDLIVGTRMSWMGLTQQRF